MTGFRPHSAGARIARVLTDLQFGLVVAIGMVIFYLPRANAAVGGMSLASFTGMAMTIFTGWALMGCMILWLNRLARRILRSFMARLIAVVLASVAMRLLMPVSLQQLNVDSHFLDFSASYESLMYELTWTTVLCAALGTAYLDRVEIGRSANDRVSSLQRAQQRARRQLVETRLRVLQARVDPQLFFNMLGLVRDRYATDPRAAEDLLEHLTTFLRAALPRLRTPMSTVKQELDLASAYADMLRVAGVYVHAQTTVRLDAAAGELGFPAGVLLPLLEAMLVSSVHAGGVIAMEALCSERGLRLRFQGPGTVRAEQIERVRATLADVYADQAALSSRAGMSGSWIIEVEVRNA